MRGTTLRRKEISGTYSRQEASLEEAYEEKMERDLAAYRLRLQVAMWITVAIIGLMFAHASAAWFVMVTQKKFAGN